MRKLLLFCAVFIFAAGCSKDDGPTNQNDQLVGSYWCEETDGANVARAIGFAINSNCFVGWDGESGYLTPNGTFEYKAPNITIKFVSGAIMYTGTISGNTMKLKSADSETGNLELTKIR